MQIKTKYGISIQNLNISPNGSFGFDLIATYSAIDEGNSFEYGFANRNVLVVFEEQNNQTKVTITFDPETENPIELQQQGWQAILDNFKSYVELNS
jgi:hypothetical protein